MPAVRRSTVFLHISLATEQSVGLLSSLLYSRMQHFYVVSKFDISLSNPKKYQASKLLQMPHAVMMLDIVQIADEFVHKMFYFSFTATVTTPLVSPRSKEKKHLRDVSDNKSRA